MHCLLHEKLKSINQHGLNLVFNIALREVFDDTAVELGTALLQYLHGDLSEENGRKRLRYSQLAELFN